MSVICNVLTTIGAVCFLVGIITYLLPMIWAALTHKPQSLKRRYNAKWAVVTGGSSGIGLEIVKRLAEDGINVVVIGLKDALLEKAMKQLKTDYKDVEFKEVAVTLGAGNYLEVIENECKGLPINLVFCNAGYMVTGFFEDSNWSRHQANIDCNATAAAAVAHLFLKKMRATNMKGAIAFTSSPAGMMPSPFSCLYGATKAFLTQFACSLAGELYHDGIDVSVLHPSPVASEFYKGAHNMPTLMAFKNTAVGPQIVADQLLAGIGRSVIIDHGYYPPLLRIMFRFLDGTFLAEIVARVSHLTNDYKTLKAGQTLKAQ